MGRVVVSVRDLEQVKLLVFQLKALVTLLEENEIKSPREVAAHIERIVDRFTGTRLEDDRNY